MALGDTQQPVASMWPGLLLGSIKCYIDSWPDLGAKLERNSQSWYNSITTPLQSTYNNLIACFVLTIPTLQMRLRPKELRPLAIRPLSWGQKASKWWNLDTHLRLSGSKASIAHRVSHSTFFTKQWRQIIVNHSSRAHSCRRSFLLSTSLSSIHMSRESL